MPATPPDAAACLSSRAASCNLRYQSLQPHVPEAATACTRGCNRLYLRLQPHVLEAATGARVKVELRGLKGGGHGVERVKNSATYGRSGRRVKGVTGSATLRALRAAPPAGSAAGRHGRGRRGRARRRGRRPHRAAPGRRPSGARGPTVSQSAGAWARTYGRKEVSMGAGWARVDP